MDIGLSMLEDLKCVQWDVKPYYTHTLEDGHIVSRRATGNSLFDNAKFSPAKKKIPENSS